MKKRRILRLILLLAVLAALVAGGAVRVVLSRVAASDEFRIFAEQRAGEYLKAKVSIGNIRPYRFNQLALENVIIEFPPMGGGSQLVRLDRLIFCYHLSQLWNRNLEAPAGVTFRNPSMIVENGDFPYQYFETPARAEMPALNFKGGEIRYHIPAIGREIVLRDIDGKVTPDAELKVRIDIRASASGFLEGDVFVRGVVDPVRRTHDLWLELGGMDFSRDIPLPFRGLTGKIHWTGKNLVFNDVATVVHGWSAKLSGKFSSEDGKPQLSFRSLIGKENPWITFDFMLDLSGQRVEGGLDIAGVGRYSFDGSARLAGRRFIMDSLMLNGLYQGRGELDFASGNYEIAVEKGSRRISVMSNLRGLDFTVRGKLDHLDLFGMDAVTQGRLYIHALDPAWQDRQFRFKADLETDYFIINQEPLQDLKGSFDISPMGITGIRFSWGRKFEMTGQVMPPLKAPQAKLVIRTVSFDLGQVQFFASRPLPKELGGLMDGKLSIEGDLRRPEFAATINIRDGKWGKIDYDRGIIQFRGFSPYFPLQDSKIWKGRSVFFLTGAVDLTLDNMLAGVKIETLDRLVVWKGFEVTLHEKDSSVQLVKGTNIDVPVPSIDVGAVRPSGDRNGNRDGDGRPDEKGLTVGTKLKF